VQLADPTKSPDPSLVKVTLPVGVVGVLEVSTTCAVHMVVVPLKIELGVQSTEVLVDWRAGVTIKFVRPTSTILASEMAELS